MRSNGPAFTLLDLIACIGLAAVVSAVGVPAVRTATSDNSLQRCRYNYRFISQASAMYQEDFGGQMWALNWKKGMQSPELVGSRPFIFGSDLEGQAFQAILRARALTGLSKNELSVPSNWVANIRMAHIALADYIGIPLPASYLICPNDARRQEVLRLGFNPNWNKGPDTPTYQQLTSSYVWDFYYFTPSRQVRTVVGLEEYRSPMFSWINSMDFLYIDQSIGAVIKDGVISQKRAADVSFPSSKVFLSEDYARHSGPERYHAYSDAAQDLLFHDGSVRWYRTDHTDPGWNPQSPTARNNMKVRFPFRKSADYWGGLDNNKASDTFAAGWYRWTRGGLLGWDVPRLSSMVGKPPSSSVVENELDTSLATGSW